MSLMIAETAVLPTPAPACVESIADVISYATTECAFGQLLVARSAKGVCAVLVGTHREELEAQLATRFPKGTLVPNEAVAQDLAKVVRFLDKPAEGLHLPLDMRGTPFQRRVWEKIRAVRTGRTVTYTELARWISPLASPPAVAAACAANPIALAIPCHRVVRSHGDLGDYRWGIERKRELISKESDAMRTR
jgi:O-6-methylguanine DNA methyltransferase